MQRSFLARRLAVVHCLLSCLGNARLSASPFVSRASRFLVFSLLPLSSFLFTSCFFSPATPQQTSLMPCHPLAVIDPDPAHRFFLPAGQKHPASRQEHESRGVFCLFVFFCQSCIDRGWTAYDEGSERGSLRAHRRVGLSGIRSFRSCLALSVLYAYLYSILCQAILAPPPCQSKGRRSRKGKTPRRQEETGVPGDELATFLVFSGVLWGA